VGGYNMAAITYQFTPASDEALFSKMPSAAFMIHCYGIKRQQIPGWKFNKTDICKTLGLSMSTVKKYLKWLREHGYASYERLKFQFTKWQFYPSSISTEQPSSPRIIERSTFDTVEQFTSDTVLERENSLEKKEQQHESIPLPDPEPIPAQELIQEPFVVSSSETIVLEYPPQLTPDQLKNAKHTIKKCKDAALQPEVLFALAYYVSRGGVKNPCAYLAGLVRDANNGTFEPVGATTATNQGVQPLIPIWQGFGQSKPSKPEVASGFIQQARAALRGIAL